MSEKIPPRLSEIIEDFNWLEGREKLELLLEFSEKMPPLPDWLNKDTNMEQIHECMTRVFVHAERENGGRAARRDARRGNECAPQFLPADGPA